MTLAIQIITCAEKTRHDIPIIWITSCGCVRPSSAFVGILRTFIGHNIPISSVTSCGCVGSSSAFVGILRTSQPFFQGWRLVNYLHIQIKVYCQRSATFVFKVAVFNVLLRPFSESSSVPLGPNYIFLWTLYDQHFILESTNKGKQLAFYKVSSISIIS